MAIKMHSATIAFCIVACASSLHLPDHIPPCLPSDSACLKSSAESAFSNLLDGNKDLGIPPLDPLSMHDVTIDAKPGPMNVQQKYTGTKIGGLSTAKVSKFTADLKDCRLVIQMEVPVLTAQAKYEIKGQLLLFPVDTKGDVDATFKNFLINADVACELYKEGDVEFLRATTSKISFNPKEAEFHLGNLINGNPQLEKEVHNVIDGDPMAFFDLMRPAAEETWSEKLIEIVNDFLTKVPRHELFKD